MTKFTAKERELILRALTIAAEDGSIYSGGMTDAEDEKIVKEINATIEAIERKLAKP